MGKYGNAALRAAKLLNNGLVSSPQEAWAKATQEVFPSSRSSQEKGCPKGAFLGLCEEGLVKGVVPGHYTGSKRNKGYAVDAVALLKADPSLAADEDFLWFKVLKGEEKTPNSQMDVVISLWNNNLIQK